MDRNSLIGLLLIAVLLVVYSVFMTPSKEERAEAQRINDSIQQARVEQQLEKERLEQLRDTTRISVEEPDLTRTMDQLERKLGVFAGAGQGENKTIILENELIRVNISSLGGRVTSAELKKYKTHDSLPLILFEEETSRFNLQFFSQNKVILTQDLFFEPSTDRQKIVVSDAPESVTMRLDAGEGRYMDYIYTLNPGTHKLGMQIKMVGMNEVMGNNDRYIDLDWSMPLKQQEKGEKFEKQYSSIYYKHFEDEVEHLQSRKEEGEADVPTSVKWIGFKQQFFSTVLFSGEAFTRASLRMEATAENSGYLKHCYAQISLPLEGKNEEIVPLDFYFVPNHFKTLKDYGYELQSLVDLGWPFIAWINKWFVVNIFHFLESKIASYGLIIIILTIFFKLLLLPLSYRSYMSGAKMRVLKPQLEEITKKFPKEKAMEKQQATMAFYKKVGVSPMGGCLPSLLQMPIWLALFRFFPASIELRQKSFLWADDLSSYDSILNLPFNIPMYGDHVSLFTLLMAASMVFSTRINMQQTDTGQQMPGMKVMMYMMPVMMLVFFNSYSSGLSFYYLVSNLITFGQMALIKRTINEEKLLKKLNQSQKKPAKKSRFQARLEQMAKERSGVQPQKRKKR